MIEELRKIGLNEKEAKTYLTLLQFGELAVSEISRKTSLNRSQTYDFLRNLTDKGLAAYLIRNNIRYYKATDPTKIDEMLKEKEKVYNQILPKLQQLYTPKGSKPVIEILDGVEGIKTMMLDILKVKQDWYGFNIPGKGPQVLGARAHSFEKERQDLGIKTKIICINTPDSLKRAKEFSEMKHTIVKIMPQSYESPASNWIYGDRVIIVFWYPDNPFVVRIIDKKLADSYRDYFNAMWKVALDLPQR